MHSGVSKPYLQQCLRRNPWKIIFGNIQTSPPLGIFIGQTLPERAVDSKITIPCLDNIGRSIDDFILENLQTVIPRKLVIVKDMTV